MPETRPPLIQTPRLCLRPIEEADSPAVAEILTHEEVGKTYMVPEFSSPEVVRRLTEVFCRLSHSPDRFVYGIFREDRLVGLLNDVGIEGSEIELGYVIHPLHQNRGYATEALSAALETLFRMGFTLVKTGAFPGNIPSIRVMEKCGMVRLPQREEIAYRGKTQLCVLFEKRP